MPTSPRSPLSFRTAGFPQYGWKAGMSDGAFPVRPPLKPAPGIRRLPHGLPPSFARLVVWVGVPALCRADDSIARRLGVGLYSAPGVLAPVRVILSRSFFAYRPHPPHSQAHRDFVALRLIRDAFAVRERLGDPRVVPSFRCPFLPGMPPPMSPERSEPCSSSSSNSDIGLRQDLSSSALSLILPSVSSRARISGLTGSPSLRPVRLLAPLDGSDQDFSQPQGLLHPGFPRVGLPSRCWI